MNNFNTYFTNHPDSMSFYKNRFGVGYDCGTNLPGKLSVSESFDTTAFANTIAIYAQNTDSARTGLLTFTGVKADVNTIQLQPKVFHYGGDFMATNADLNFGIRGIGGRGKANYGGYFIGADNSVTTYPTQNYGTYNIANGGVNSSNIGVYSRAYNGKINSGVASFANGTGTYNYGLQTEVFSSSASTVNYGVHSKAPSTGANRAGYFDGILEVVGVPLIGSDQQFKTDVNKIEGSLKAIQALRPVTYYMDTTNFTQFSFDSKKQFGFIAQEVETTFPNLVYQSLHPAEYDSLGNEITPATSYKSLNYNGLIPINTQAIIELNQKVDKATLSDQSIKTNVQDLSGSLDKVLNMHGVSYDWNHTVHPELNLDSANHVGFIAQEMAQIDARLTYLADDSLLHIEYDKVVPILAEAIQELNDSIGSRDSIISVLVNQNAAQQTTINDLNNRLTQLENCLSGILPLLCQLSQQAIQNNTPAQQEEVRAQLSVRLANKEAIILDQNVPNPFAEQTVINFSIPATVQKAQIHFYDSNGKIIQSVDVVERGLGSLTVFGADLSTGIYTYTLVADGQIVATKKMMKE
ncbi:MAG: tail fiber domain-containing protein [Fluviicola sp.]|nr:tail fiber domain-containing protein [Fluviicola sp.]